jgi:hypothetical protein
MAIREYKCTCGFKSEEILPITQEPPKNKVCAKCGSQANLVEFSLSSFTRSTFQEAPIDVKVGADASKKWERYHERQAERNKVRKKTGSLGLTEINPGEYVPISEERKREREVGVAARSGGVPQDSEWDSLKH